MIRRKNGNALMRARFLVGICLATAGTFALADVPGSSTPPPPTYDGSALYAANCANCHGTYGEGDGIVTPALSVALQDLRYLADRNGGEYPADFIREIVDGRAMRAAHGPDGMPIWGAEFARGEGFDEAAEARVAAKIDALVDFLSTIQIGEAP